MALHSGIGRYIRGLVSALKSTSEHDRYVLIGNERACETFGEKGPFIRTGIRVYSVGEQLVLPMLARSCECLHSPHYNAPLLWRKKLIVTIHDLIHLHFPQLLPSPFARTYASWMLPLVVKKADAIITVSEFTKKDVVERFGVRPDKITVVYHGIDPKFRFKTDRPAPITNSTPYFLYVGLLKAHKNIGVLLSAFEALKKKVGKTQLRLQLVGKADTKQQEVKRWLEIIRHNPDISLTTNVDDEELACLYQNAIALVLPSLYEGFGFPLIEAMALKTPIIAAYSTSIPEILGSGNGLLFDPHSGDELMRHMKTLLETDSLRRELISKGMCRAAHFDWAASAAKTRQVYENVLGSN